MRRTLPSGTPVEVATPADGSAPRTWAGADPRHHGAAAAVRRPRPAARRRQRLGGRGGGAVARAGGPAARGTARQLVGTIDDRAFLADLVAAADLLEVEPVGVTGLLHGRHVHAKAAGTGRFHRAVASTGCSRCPSTGRASDTIEPLDAVQRRGRVPDDGHRRHGRPVDTARPTSTAAEAAGVTVVRYEGADHGFVHDDSRPAHRADDAADAWRQAIAFLSE